MAGKGFTGQLSSVGSMCAAANDFDHDQKKKTTSSVLRVPKTSVSDTLKISITDNHFN